MVLPRGPRAGAPSAGTGLPPTSAAGPDLQAALDLWPSDEVAGPAPALEGAPGRPGGRTPLAETTFCVVDLETTGASPSACRITEVGAVRVRGGEVLAELGVLVDPGERIPAPIAALTGITDAMVSGAPRISSVLPSLLEMLSGAVVVAHNARFDVGFLRAACEREHLVWPEQPVLDTLGLARAVLPRGEVPNHKLGTLAAHLGATTSPTHRALDDARATVDVLHALISRLGRRASTLGDLVAVAGPAVPAVVRERRHLAADVPSAPGVYLFSDAGGRVLYVGTSRDLRARVRSYFTAAERRPRLREMVALAARVTPVVCGSVLEAQVRELRLIAEHDPPYNRRSRRPERAPWVKLTAEAFPRLSVVRDVRADAVDGAAYVGPFGSVSAAAAAAAAVLDAFALRRCTHRLPARPTAGAVACVLAELGRCGAPCTDAAAAPAYADLVGRARRAMTGDPGAVVAAAAERTAALVAAERFEEASAVRDALAAFVRGATRAQRTAPLAAAAEVVAARRLVGGGWELVCVRHGRLAGSTASPPGADPLPYVSALRATAEVVTAPVAPSAAASAEEVEKVLAWLETDGVRLVHVEGTWACPVAGAAGTDAAAALSQRLTGAAAEPLASP